MPFNAIRENKILAKISEFTVCPCFGIQHFVSPCYFYNVLAGNERAGCFTFIVFLLSYGCNSSLSLPHGVMTWFAVCGCGF